MNQKPRKQQNKGECILETPFAVLDSENVVAAYDKRFEIASQAMQKDSICPHAAHSVFISAVNISRKKHANTLWVDK